MKAKYAELFTAKLNDMDLVLFEKHRVWARWTIAKQSDKCFMVSDNYEYFLCLPQHKEACLHWLNGGEVEYFIRSKNKWGMVESIEDAIESECERLECLPQGEEMKHFNPTEWSKESIFMRDDFKLRIKPKKEKRWIGVNVTTGKTTSAYAHDDEGNYAEDEVRLTNGNLSEWQFIEIEVEV